MTAPTAKPSVSTLSGFSRLSSSERDRWLMGHAIALAIRASGMTKPNPCVGAVVFKNGKIVGEGYHRRAGAPHAEIVALKAAGSRARGATLFVNLEPCCHHGKTPPCVDAIVSAGVREVVYALRDPNPVVRGKGAQYLSRHGVKVRSGILAAEAREINEVYLAPFGLGRPFVILKTAQTIDGRIAAKDGTSRWISGPESLHLSHHLRALCDAVVIGAGTANADNPELTVRHTKGINPARIILSARARIRPNLKVLQNSDGQTIVATAITPTASKSLQYPYATFWRVKERAGQVDLEDFLRLAWANKIRSLLVEGGGRLATAFLRAGLVDKHIVVIAPKILGDGIAAIGDLGARTIGDIREYDRTAFTLSGKDIVFGGYPRRYPNRHTSRTTAPRAAKKAKKMG